MNLTIENKIASEEAKILFQQVKQLFYLCVVLLVSKMLNLKVSDCFFIQLEELLLGRFFMVDRNSTLLIVTNK